MNAANHMKECPCPECVARRERVAWRAIVLGFLLLAGIAFAVIGSTGCSSTVTPKPVATSEASFDGGEQNSGILKLVDGGAIITEHARERFNALIEIYGEEFLPAIEKDRGIRPDLSDGTYFITNEALQKFILMNHWRKMGRKPQ